MEEKKYYWIKVSDKFFDDKIIKKLRKIAGGDTYTIIYQRMLLAAIKQNNRIYYEGVEETLPKEIALELDEDPDNVAVLCAYLQKNGLIVDMENGEYLLTQCDEMVGSETDAARRMRISRNRRRALEEKKNPEMEPLQMFEKFWTEYPKQISSVKHDTEIAYAKAAMEGFKEVDLLEAAKNYSEACRIQAYGKQYIKMPDNFLKDGFFMRYLPGEYKRPEPPQKKGTAADRYNAGLMERDYDMESLENMLLGND